MKINNLQLENNVRTFIKYKQFFAADLALDYMRFIDGVIAVNSLQDKVIFDSMTAEQKESLYQALGKSDSMFVYNFLCACVASAAHPQKLDYDECLDLIIVNGDRLFLQDNTEHNKVLQELLATLLPQSKNTSNIDKPLKKKN